MVQPPIIVIESADIWMTQTLERAAMALEAVDVKAGAYQAFDSVGTPLALEVVDGDRVIVGEVENATARPEQLSELLRAALRARGDSGADTSLSLRELVELCSGFALE